MFDKRYQVKRTFFTVKHFPNSVDAAMPNTIKYSSNNKIFQGGTGVVVVFNVIVWVRSQVCRHSPRMVIKS